MERDHEKNTNLAVISLILPATSSMFWSIWALLVSYTFGRVNRATTPAVQSNKKLLIDTQLEQQSYKSKRRILTKNDEGHAVEPRSHIGEHPEANTELHRINEVFDKEEASQLRNNGVDVSNSQVARLSYFFSWQGKIHFQDFPGK